MGLLLIELERVKVKSLVGVVSNVCMDFFAKQLCIVWDLRNY